MTPADLEKAAKTPSVTPPVRQIPMLLDAMAGEAHEHAATLLVRVGEPAAQAAADRMVGSVAPARSRLVELLGEFARRQPKWIPLLVEALDDADAPSRKRAALALSKLGPRPDAEARMLARFDGESLPNQRAFVRTLGQIGSRASAQKLSTLSSSDAELTRLANEARLKLDRQKSRTERVAQTTPIVLEHKVTAEVIVRCRRGLESLVKDALPDAKFSRPGLLSVALNGAPKDLFGARTLLDFAFVLYSGKSSDMARTVDETLRSPRTKMILSALTDGDIRYRLEWSDAGRRRGLTMKIVSGLASVSYLKNDPLETDWQIEVHERGEEVQILAQPRSATDPRFAYRVADVPASSHPTLAAALAHVTRPRPDDVIWDPFVGAGTELVECALLAPGVQLIGTDISAEALTAAHANLKSAKVTATLTQAGVDKFSPPALTAIVTNPPMGRRVLDGRDLGALYETLFTRAANLLGGSGRLVWISPRPDETLALAKRFGFHAVERHGVDMGGFWAEIQRLEKVTPGARTAGRTSSPSTRDNRSPHRK